MEKFERKMIRENVLMKSALSAFLKYLEEDEYLSDYFGEPTVTFPNVVHSMSKAEFDELKKIVE